MLDPEKVDPEFPFLLFFIGKTFLETRDPRRHAVGLEWLGDGKMTPNSLPSFALDISRFLPSEFHPFPPLPRKVTISPPWNGLAPSHPWFGSPGQTESRDNTAAVLRAHYPVETTSGNGKRMSDNGGLAFLVS